MKFQRKYLLKYISIINYVLKSFFNKTKSQDILKTILHDLKVKILFGSQISFRCVPDSIIENLLTQCYTKKSIIKYNLQVDKCIFISEETLTKLKMINMQWVLVNVMTEDSSHLPVLQYNRIIVLYSYTKSDCLLTSTNLFNLCYCNNTHHVSMLRIIKPLVKYEPKFIKKVSISVVKPLPFNEDMQVLLDKALYNYFSLSKFASVGNILKIDLNKCYSGSEYLLKPSTTQIVYIKIVEFEGENTQKHFYNCKNSFYISNLHSKLNEVQYFTNIYLPMEKEFAINNLKNLNAKNFNDFVLNVIPDGMNGNGELLVSWIKPFMQQNYRKEFNTLKPIFLVYGCIESGKELLIASVSKYLGLRYVSQCCFDWPANNITQFKKKIEHFFDGVRKISPCLLHLENFEALCLSSTNDLEQELMDVFMRQINLKTTEPIIIIATTYTKEKLSPVFLRLFLQCQEVGNLNQTDREKLLKWILRRDCVALDNTLINTVVHHTSSYNYNSYLTLLLLSAKHHMCTNKKSTEISLNESDLMISIDKFNSMFSKSIGTPKIPTVRWDDVGGLINVKDEIMSALKTTTLSLRRSGILLYGPPGTGKTLLAKAVATEYKYNFLSIKGPELLNMYIGQSEANVREVFSKARSAVPCILFFDELDSLAPKRGQNGDSGGVGDRVVSQLLTEMDGMRSENQQIFVLGATNRLDLIDSALLRPGRLDMSIYVGACSSKESKLQVLNSLTKKFNLDSDLFLEDLTDYLPQEVTGAELYGVCHNAWLNSARRIIQQRIVHNNDQLYANNIITVTKEDFIRALYDNFNIR